MQQDINPASKRSMKDYRAATVMRAEHAEGSFTRLLEQQTARSPRTSSSSPVCARWPSPWGAELADRTRASRFVGMWVGPLLIMGVYNKMVKTFGAR